MSEPQFSPAPWYALGVTIYDASSRRIARVEKHYWPTDTKAANAHLIAAAPELYEVLDWLWDEVNKMDPTAELEDNYERIINVLAKARGEA